MQFYNQKTNQMNEERYRHIKSWQDALLLNYLDFWHNKMLAENLSIKLQLNIVADSPLYEASKLWPKKNVAGT